MNVHIIENNLVINTIAIDSIATSQALFPNAICVEASVGAIGWQYGEFGLTRPPEMTKNAEEVQEEIIKEVQSRLDVFAKTRNYDGILSACTYATDPDPRFSSEGQYCITARSATWAALYQILGEVQAGTRPAPSGYQDIEPELPALSWPN